jgi:tetratricopeptide (TPR) repeat protein
MDLEEIILNAAYQSELQKDLKGAELNYRGLLDSFPDNAVAAHRLGRLLFTTGKHDEGMVWLKKAANGPSESADILFDLGVALEKSRRYADAADIFSRVAGLRAGHGEPLFRLGLVCEALGRNDQACKAYGSAVEAFRRAATAFPDERGHQQALADALANQGIISGQKRLILEAIDIYRRVVALNPALAEVFCSMGTALDEVGQVDEAIAAYVSAVHADPRFADAYRNLGIALSKVGHFVAAGEALQSALALDADNPSNHFNLSIHRLSQGDFQRGWEGYEYRWHLSPPPAPRRNFSQPQWSGENPSGKNHLAACRAGIGRQHPIPPLRADPCRTGGKGNSGIAELSVSARGNIAGC